MKTAPPPPEGGIKERADFPPSGGLRGAVISAFANEALSPKEVAAKEAAEKATWDIVNVVAIVIFFVVAVTVFLIYKTKHDKRERKKHMAQLRKLQENKRIYDAKKRLN
ncbi:MAG: hypothetical protein ACYDCN_11385 [Bacteroidia bacterium]